ncbi:preprotein translocase subunit YajC [Pseudoalteromonas tunicata]|jgi:preprotein translocase subunit YajC|uniref:Sec translocon accessory complex subunit YajC n=1 Tax=Pseudoalteromonas tunicata D2 TaxID=87626 RepID=A4C7I6_9GAMM|nr:preprotein translocase subunit YajC [Pseudoalteromonas tunicata]ATC95910.1 preprotein translocase subunit YajC [Pseudoalteromonas tunicata]AXT31452.1 preprotein translocase subunit YajC [Pseudoalteromonas tunicata]EAR29940.1 putative preprotein translocase IISP family, membrane subunit [Pseudoalteromonas tunicata D2]MDP4983760.1 preprotein translocase subunit YajC [Pseudoalteromonas tunicata]MDP5214270.1 preprotein translocase subunit YajC [Pseudoalteromonas tunicata]
MSLFMSNAYAADAPAAAGGGMEMLIMLAIFGLVFYFLIYRPQAKRVKDHKDLMGALAKGDEVLTSGGLVGKISKVADDKDFVVIALNDQTQVTVQKGAISAVLPKGTMKAL